MLGGLDRPWSGSLIGVENKVVSRMYGGADIATADPSRPLHLTPSQNDSPPIFFELLFWHLEEHLFEGEMKVFDGLDEK